jgi:hypothetical protein
MTDPTTLAGAHLTNCPRYVPPLPAPHSPVSSASTTAVAVGSGSLTREDGHEQRSSSSSSAASVRPATAAAQDTSTTTSTSATAQSVPRPPRHRSCTTDGIIPSIDNLHAYTGVGQFNDGASDEEETGANDAVGMGGGVEQGDGKTDTHSPSTLAFGSTTTSTTPATGHRRHRDRDPAVFSDEDEDEEEEEEEDQMGDAARPLMFRAVAVNVNVAPSAAARYDRGTAPWLITCLRLFAGVCSCRCISSAFSFSSSFLPILCCIFLCFLWSWFPLPLCFPFLLPTHPSPHKQGWG